MTGQIECLVFPRVFEKYRPLLNEDAAVVISGKISVREEEAPKLLAERVARLAEWDPKHAAPAGDGRTQRETLTDAQIAAKAEKKLFLRLERNRMESVTAMLALSAGNVPVYMHIPEEKITLLCPREHWINADEACMERLRGELGAENVVLK
jgi:DNA polymerase-3 subunit alpha